MDNIEFLHMDR